METLDTKSKKSYYTISVKNNKNKSIYQNMRLTYLGIVHNIQIISSEEFTGNKDNTKKLVIIKIDDIINISYYFDVTIKGEKFENKKKGFLVNKDFKIYKVYYCNKEELWVKKNLSKFNMLIGYHDKKKYYLNHIGETITEVINLDDYMGKYNPEITDLDILNEEDNVLISDNPNIKECLILCFKSYDTQIRFLKYIRICTFLSGLLVLVKT
jgi:hypothetical protein